MQAMILAAGFGTRLQPYSLVRPKPLFPLLNKPLLLATIDRLKNSNFNEITVNCHHLREQVVALLKDREGVIIQEEPHILGTGGGLRRALDRLRDEPLLVTNGDIYHSIDYAAVYDYHLKAGMEVTMALHDCRRFNNVEVSSDCVTGFHSTTGELGNRAFTGLQVLNPEVLSTITPETYSCIIEHYRSMIKSGRKIGFFMAEEPHWTDMGTPRDYLELHAALLQGEVPVWPELDCTQNSTILVDNGARCDEGSRFEQWACVGKAHIGAGATVRRSVVWDGAHVLAQSKISDRIVIPESV